MSLLPVRKGDVGGKSALLVRADGDGRALGHVDDLAGAGGAADSRPVQLRSGEYLLGSPDRSPYVCNLVGYCAFASSDADLLVSLLPQLVHVRGEKRLSALVRMVNEESPGLLRGLGDDRLAVALRHIHERPTAPWTVAQLAKEAALSRSTFFERFRQAVGVAPMEYLLQWRMALAKDMLRRRDGGIADVAERVGYSSASTFSVAFTRHVGVPPTVYARRQEEGEATPAEPATTGVAP